MKTMKKMRLFLIVAAFAVFISGTVEAKSAKKNSTKEAWTSAYVKVVQKYNKEDLARKRKYTWGYKPYTYDLIYFNNDSIPELVISNSGYWVSMYTYNKKGKKAVEIMDHWGYGAMGNPGYQYVPKKNVLYNCNSDHAGAVVYHSVMKLKNNKLVRKYKKELVERYFVDKNKNGSVDEGEYFSKAKYYYGKTRITKKKFKSYMPKGKLKNIVGKNTYAQIRRRLTPNGIK